MYSFSFFRSHLINIYEKNGTVKTSPDNRKVRIITKTKKGLCFKNDKTKTPEFTFKFDLKLGGKNRTEDNLTD